MPSHPQQQPQQQQQQQLGQDADTAASTLSENKSSAQLPSPLEDLDVISGKQVILRPRLSNDEIIIGSKEESKMMMLPPPVPMGINAASSSSLSSSKTVVDGESSQSQPVVYYYDPQTLIQSPSSLQSSSSFSSSGNGKSDAEVVDTTPELTLPEVVYTSSGNPISLEQVHNGGRNEVFLEIKKPKEAAVWGSSGSGIGGSGGTGAWNTVQNKLHLHGSTSSSATTTATAWHSQDQLIVLCTVLTMAIMVGALSARRLRNQHILESCMHPDLTEDEDDLEDFHVIGSVCGTRNHGRGVGGGVRYDKKYDLDTGRSVVSGFSVITGSAGVGGSRLNSSDFGALLGGGGIGGGGSGGYYGTTNGMMNGGGGGGQLHWRGGDMEKFDV
ncbi:hypothetical protein ACHAXH_002704 [Discostella pseudostelligera]